MSKDTIASDDESIQTVEYDAEQELNNLDQDIVMELVRRSICERTIPFKLTEYKVNLTES